MGDRSDPEQLTTWGSGDHLPNALRIGDAVMKSAGPWTPAVHALLAHFEEVGFAGAPRLVDGGLTSDGRELLEFVPGASAHPRAWSADDLGPIGAVLRQAHDASRTFRPAPEAVWQPWFGRSLPGHDPVIGHCDVGPWNIVVSPGRVVLIDWEFAGPVDSIWEVAHAVWLNAQLHDDDIAELHGLPSAVERAGHTRLLIDGYGLTARERRGFVDRMIELAIHSARAEAVQYGVRPDTSTAIGPDGYPVLWAITWRSRDASWMLRNRRVLERAVTGASVV